MTQYQPNTNMVSGASPDELLTELKFRAEADPSIISDITKQGIIKQDRTIYVTIKNVYGNDLIYPACDDSNVFAELIGQKTLTTSDCYLYCYTIIRSMYRSDIYCNDDDQPDSGDHSDEYSKL